MKMIVSLVVVFVVSSLSLQVSGQVTTACTSSLLQSFTPCLNYLSAGTNGGSSPTTECCKSLASLQFPLSHLVREMKMIISLAVVFIVSSLSLQVSGQVTTACTSSLLQSFTPCLNYLTGGTSGGSSPTTECCKSMASLIGSGTECLCLVVNGNVPFSLPINRTLAISLPNLCKSQSAALLCQGFIFFPAATVMPPPGPVSATPRAPGTTTPAMAPALDQPESPPAADNTPLNQQLDQLINQSSSAINLRYMNLPTFLMIFALAGLLFNEL